VIVSRTNQIISEQAKRQLPTDQVEQGLRAAIDQSFSATRAALLYEGQRRGMSEDALRGLTNDLDQAREDAYNVASGVAQDVTGPDPEKASASLAALYSGSHLPDPVVEEDKYNPAWGIGLGLLGGVAGFAAGGPVGAGMGFTAGSLAGNAFANARAYG
jgi:hypothetical protein